MNFLTGPYLSQQSRWPQAGRHILAQYDDTTIVVYQAYRPAIGHFAARHGYFGGKFSLSRMSWIKPNFLWMMYRSGWGTKEGQEVTLAVRLKRSAFDTILSEAVHSTFLPDVYANEAEWKHAVNNSSVRVQWDPDHDPSGVKLERRAIQVGMRGNVLRQYAHDWILDVEDISEFVQKQRQHVLTGNYNELITPEETVYSIEDEQVARKLQINTV